MIDPIDSSTWATDTLRTGEPVPDLRAALVAHARSLVGLTADPAKPECRAGYLATIAPGETPQRASEMALMSGCELAALRGYLGHFITHPLITEPYRDRKAGEDLLRVAREAHAVRPAGELPEPGDVVIVNSADGKHEHAWIWIGDDRGVDGGQRDAKGFECIVERGHEIRGNVDATATYQRGIVAILDAAKIVDAFHA